MSKVNFGRALGRECIDVEQSALFPDGSPKCLNEHILTDQGASGMPPVLAASLREASWSALVLMWIPWLATIRGIRALVRQSIVLL